MKKENAINFLLFGYFGITLENSKDDIISAAINRAYRDAASHVLSLKDDSKKDTENGKKLFADACDCIEKFIEAVLPNEAQNEIDYDNKLWRSSEMGKYDYEISWHHSYNICRMQR